MLAAKQKRGQDPTLNTNRRTMIEPFLSTTLDIVDKFPALKPEEAWTMFQEKHSDDAVEGHPKKKKFKSKFSSEKRKRLSSNNE